MTLKIKTLNEAALPGLIESAIVISGLPYYTGNDFDEFYNQELNRMADRTETARKLGKVKPGTGHDPFLKMITVSAAFWITGYQQVQIQRYRGYFIGGSASKTHRIGKMNVREALDPRYINETIILEIEKLQREYRQARSFEIKCKTAYKENSSLQNKINWDNSKNLSYEARMMLLNMLPQGFHLWQGVTLTYLQIKTIYLQRRNHPLKEDWGTFCKWADSLPRFNELTGIKPYED